MQYPSYYFEDYSKSAQGKILFLLVTCSNIPRLLKNAEKRTVNDFPLRIFLKAQCERADFRPERVDFRPERADFRPERAWWDERNDGMTE